MKRKILTWIVTLIGAFIVFMGAQPVFGFGVNTPGGVLSLFWYPADSVSWRTVTLTPGNVHELIVLDERPTAWGIVRTQTLGFGEIAAYNGYVRTVQDKGIGNVRKSCGIKRDIMPYDPAEDAREILRKLSDMTGEEMLDGCAYGFEAAAQALLGFVPDATTEWSMHYRHDADVVASTGSAFVVMLDGPLYDLNPETAEYNSVLISDATVTVTYRAEDDGHSCDYLSIISADGTEDTECVFNGFAVIHDVADPSLFAGSPYDAERVLNVKTYHP